MVMLDKCIFRICSICLIALLFPYLPLLPNVISHPIDHVSIPQSRYSRGQQQLPFTENSIEENFGERKNKARRKLLGNYLDNL